jgi:ubiquinone biosynthesis protein Coq4
VQAVRYHDLHHVATGYDTDFRGEGEIGAWEVATGCRGYVAAWWLNLIAMWIGCMIAPRRIFRAFVRGRHTRNLYGERFDDALLADSVGGVRGRLGLAHEVTSTPADRAAFAGWALAAFAAYAFQSAVVLAPFELQAMWLL